VKYFFRKNFSTEMCFIKLIWQQFTVVKMIFKTLTSIVVMHLEYRALSKREQRKNIFIIYQNTLFMLSTLLNIYPIFFQSGFFSHLTSFTRWLNSSIFITNNHMFSMNKTIQRNAITAFNTNVTNMPFTYFLQVFIP